VTRRSQLCATVTAATTADLRRRRDAVVGATLVELRLDTVVDPDPAGALAGRRTPVIVTCRPAWEGGSFAGSEEERRGILEQALALGADYVDVEWRAGFSELIAARPERVVVSSHDFAGIPADLDTRLAAMHSTNARVVKMAVTPHRLADVLTLKQAVSRLEAGRVVAIAMGERGLATRVLPERFGSAWTYAGDLASVGQVSVRTLVDRFRFNDVTPEAAVYGVAGSPVSHSVSPAMHNASFRALGLDAVYLPLPASDVTDLFEFADGMDLQGASVTIPFKVPLLDRVDQLDDFARRAGAVNTLRRMDDGLWSGANTDVAGFLQPLDDRGIGLRGIRASILGAGGSARAVALALGSRDARVTVHARQRSAAAAVAQLVQGAAGEWPPPKGTWDLLVNCTPCGMYPNVSASPLPPASLDGVVVYDLIYNPGQTRLLQDAAAAGCRTIGGLDMLVAQAEAQCHWWTGQKPPEGVMQTAALERLSEFSNEHHVV